MALERQSYHHKNLRNTLIETGIELVHTEGIHSFSLRKVAAACGVSHAAPYSHFQNKEALLDAMQVFIIEKFSALLEYTVQKRKPVAALLRDLGVTYVSFFVEHPAYFQFLYTHSNIKIDLSLSIPDEQNYQPYIIYRDVVCRLLAQTKHPTEKQNDMIISIWAFIHGVTALATMDNVSYQKDWTQKVLDFMEVFQLPCLDGNGDPT